MHDRVRHSSTSERDGSEGGDPEPLSESSNPQESPGDGDFEEVLEAAGIGVWGWDPATGVVRWSRATSALFGLGLGEFEGTFDHYVRLIHADDRERLLAAIQQTIDTDADYRVDHRVLLPGNQERWLTGIGRAFRGADGATERLAGVVFDSTDRKQAEQSLRESEERFRAFAESAVEGIAFSQDGRVVDANRAVELLLGYDPGKLVGEPVHRFVAPEDFELVARRVRSGYEAPYEHRALRRDGSRVWVEACGRSVIYRGRPSRMTSIRDISERKESESALRERDEALRALVETSRDWIWTLDRDGRCTYTNPAFEAILDYDPREILGKRVFQLLHDEDRSWVEAEYPRWVSSKQGWSNRLMRWRHRDGHYRHLESSAVPILDQTGELIGFRGVDRDITDRIRFDEEKQHLEAQLLQAQKMEAVGRLAGGVAHDFNNLLTVIHGNLGSAVECLASESTGQQELRELLNEAAARADKAGALVSQLLAFSRRQISRPRIVDVNRQVAELERMLRRLLTENIELVVELSSAIALARVDPGQFQQVVMNLVVNARDAMPQGGTLTIATRVLFDEQEASAQGSRRRTDQIIISVADTGVGMAPDVLDHIFEPFFTTKELGEGTGLGLATAYGIVAQAGGHIDVVSQVGQGTRFDLFLPAAVGEPQSLRPARVSRRTLEGHETVLVCEDDPVVRRMLARTLRRAGYSVWEADSGVHALRLIREHRPSIDLLLTDVVMPEMNGHQVATALQRVYPKLRTLYCSGYATEVFANQEELPLESEILSKPFKTETLLERVRDALERKR